MFRRDDDSAGPADRGTAGRLPGRVDRRAHEALRPPHRGGRRRPRHPGGLGLRLRGAERGRQDDDHQDFGITYTHGLVVAVGYIAVAIAAASVTFARRDVTA
jgi:hypothetical protein